MKKILFFGGDRLKENMPLSFLAEYFTRSKIKVIIVTDPIHLKKLSIQGITFKDYLKKKKLKYIFFNKLNEKKIIKLIDKNTIGFSINSIWKFSEKIINAFKGNFYNYHAADMPSERGAGNVSWKILQGNIKKGSINIHLIDKEFDTGDIVARKKISFSNKGKAVLPENILKITAKNEKLFLKSFLNRMIKNKKNKKIKQKHSDSYYWPRLNSDRDGRINWSWDAKDIISFVRAFSKPYNGAFTFIGKSKINIFNAEIYSTKKKFHPYQNGIVFRKDKKYIYVSNQKGSIKIKIKDIHFAKNTKFLGKKFR